MLVNKDYDHAHSVKIVFHGDAAGADEHVQRRGDADHVWQKSSTHGIRRGNRGYADPDGPVGACRRCKATASSVYELPAASLTVLRGRDGCGGAELMK